MASRRPPPSPAVPFRGRERDAPSPSDPESTGERLRVVLPLLFIAAACGVISYLLFSQIDPAHPTRIPLWILSASIGIVSAVGGTTAFFFGEFPDDDETASFAAQALASGEYVLVSKRDWLARSASLEVGPREATEPRESLGLAPPPSFEDRPAPTPVGRTHPPSVAAPPAEPRSTDWTEEPPEATPERASRPADRLAAEVDDLLSELNRRSEPTSVVEHRAERRPLPPTDSKSGTAPRPKTSPAAGRTRAQPPPTTHLLDPEREERLARLDYETLLTQLEISPPSTPPSSGGDRRFHCAECGRTLATDEPWEACPICWQVYCPTCTTKRKGLDGTLRCAHGGSRS